MPGVISAMAQAAGFGTGKDASAKLFKAMEAGTVRSVDVLEEFSRILEERAKAGGALEKAMKTTAAEQARFNNAVSDMVEMMAIAGSDSGFAKMFASMSNFLKDNTKLINSLGVSIDRLGDFMTEAGIHLTSLIDGFDRLGDSLGIGGTNLSIFAAGALILATHFGRIAAALGLFLLVLEDVAVGMRGGKSLTGEFLAFMEENKWLAAAAGAAAFAGALFMVANAIGKIGGGMGSIPGAGKGGLFGGLSSILKHPLILALMAGVGGTMAYQASENAALQTDRDSYYAGLNSDPEYTNNKRVLLERQMSARGLPMPTPEQLLANMKAAADNREAILGKPASTNAVYFGDLSVVFNGSPDQMMGSNVFEEYMKATLTKAAIEMNGDN